MRTHRFLPFVFVLSVGSALAQQAIHTLPGDSSTPKFGWSVAGVGDLDGDGFADFAAGTGGTAKQPKLQVFSGKTGATLYTFLGTQNYDGLGVSVSGAGDVNGDGFPDLVAGTWFIQNTAPGYARVFSGQDGSVLYTFTGSTAEERYGHTVAGADDANGDGFADLLVGAPFANTAGTHSGRTQLLSGKDGSVLLALPGGGAGEHFGQALARVGDVDRDGFPDFAVGSPRSNCCAEQPGKVRVYSGKSGALLLTFSGTGTNDRFGFSVSGAGDWNGDDRAEILVGVPGPAIDNPFNVFPGEAKLYSGIDGSLLQTWSGSGPSAHFGWSVAGLGDVDNDGFPDLAVGSKLDEPDGGKSNGSARVISGKANETRYVLYGNLSYSQYGYSVAAGGDVNGDGFPDLLVGEPYAGSGKVHALSLVPQGVSFFGSGLAGCSGSHLVNANSVPAAPNREFRLTVNNAPPLSLGLWFIGPEQNPAGDDPFGWGIPFWVAPSPETISVFTFVDAQGYGNALFAIPNDPSLVGTTYHAQSVSLWGASCSLPPNNMSASGGISLTIQ